MHNCYQVKARPTEQTPLTPVPLRFSLLFTDTENIYENIVRDIAKAHNKPYPYDVRMRILGTTEQMTAKIAVNELHLPITVDEFKLHFSDLGRKRLANVTLLKGIFGPACQAYSYRLLRSFEFNFRAFSGRANFASFYYRLQNTRWFYLSVRLPQPTDIPSQSTTNTSFFCS